MSFRIGVNFYKAARLEPLPPTFKLLGFWFRLGLRSRPRWGSLQRSPRPPSWIWGPTSKEREREGRRGKGRGGRGREGKGGRAMSPPPTIWRKFTPMNTAD